ncbi:MAG: APC family permease [Gaiellales bacterium]|nr:MAG: APC family permease [Gaiellales bacterium]
MTLKRMLLGQPIESVREQHERMPKAMGLAIFSSDALSSVAYATEEILLALVLAGTVMLGYSMPISISIAALIAIVATSYYQIIHAYPSGGGAYVVTRENLGVNAGLVAGASLMIDYVLTVAVSITAGVAALTSAFPAIHEHRVLIGIAGIVILMFINLRGVREAGYIFSVPTYVFLASLFMLIGYGIYRYFFQDHPPMPEYVQPPSDYLPLFIILRAFASGCAALTGIEAMSNGVQAFRKPEARNASVTLVWLAVLLGSLFIGITFLADHYGIIPSESETVLSQLARAVFSTGPFYYLVQFATTLILFLAANTSFAGFPRLASVMAADRFLPRQLASRGDKLVFSNGIIILGFFAALLIVIFGGATHALIPLYAVGVFLSFTLAQAGMVRHWFRERGRGWRRGAAINGFGAATTLLVLSVIAAVKFTHGAWLVVITIPVLVYLTRRVNSHYRSIAEQLSLEGVAAPGEFSHHAVIIPVSGVHRAVLAAVKYAKAISDDVTAVYVCFDPAETEKIEAKWEDYGMEVPLVVLASPYRSVISPLMRYIDYVRGKNKDGVVTVVLPEFVPTKWWHHLLHNQTALIIKGMLLFRKDVVSTSVPMRLTE